MFEEIYRPARPSPPAQVTEILVDLALAREHYRLEHAAARRSTGTPLAAAASDGDGLPLAD